MSYDNKLARSRFIGLGQEYGGFISHADVEYIIQINEDLPKSGIDNVPLPELFERRQWEVLRRFDMFKTEMLEEHQMLLVNVRGQGYRIANPNEHAELAATTFTDDLGKAARKASNSLKHTNRDMLTAAEAARHAEVEVRIAGLTVHIKNNLPPEVKYKPRRIGSK
jgi:hypothetical protein